jgi:Putative Ig domain
VSRSLPDGSRGLSRPGRRPRGQVRRPRLELEILEDRALPSGATIHPTVVLFHAAGEKPAGHASPPTSAHIPAQITQAYGISSAITGDGTGATIALVDAYDDPALASRSSTLSLSQDTAFLNSDLHQFDVKYNLPEPAGFFTKVNQSGGISYPSTDPAGAGNPNGNWEGEEALDVEWAHAIAPGAKIVLVEANNDFDGTSLFSAASWAGKQSGAQVVSLSWGGNETPTETSMDKDFTSPSGHGVTFLGASGDTGASGSGIGDGTGYPEYSPDVVAVGGTTLTLSGGTYGSEIGWDASGGGISSFEAKPSYQSTVTQSSTRRTNPDVSFDADPSTGVIEYDSYNGNSTGGPWYQVGGTSLSSPAWAGIIALADGLRASQGLGSLDGPSQTLPTLYKLASSGFHDITSGNNGYSAGAGYDLVTGLGTPIANRLVPDLAGLWVSASTPASAGTVTMPLTTFTLTFSAAVTPSSLHASAFTVNGVAATSVSLNVADTVATFGFTSSPVTAQGPQTMAFAAGSVAQLDNPSTTNLAYSASFTFQAVALAVSATSPAPGSVIAVPASSLTFNVTFNEAIDPSLVSTSNLSLSQGTVTTAVVMSGNQTVAYTITGLSTAGTLTVTLPAGTLKDQTDSVSVSAFTGMYTLVQPVAITNNPTSQSVLVGQPVTFTAAASGDPTPTVEWQVSTDNGATYTPITGATSTSFTIGATALSQNGSFYEAIFTNPAGSVATSPALLTVTKPTLTLQPSALPAGNLNVPYNQTFTAAGGSGGSYTFTETGTLPAGLTLSSAGVLSGTPTTFGTFPLTVTAMDNVGDSGSQNYTLTIASPVHLSVNSPASATAGTGFVFTVQTLDANNDPTSAFTGRVTFSTTNPQGIVPAPVTVSNGFGVFLATLYTAAGGPWTITATSGSMTATSSAIPVTPGPAVKLGFVTQPVSTPTGDVLPAVTVQVTDLYGNTITADNTDMVMVGVASGPGSLMATSTTTAVVQNGVATFSNLSFAAVGSYTLSAVVPGLYTGPNSTPFSVTPLQVVPGSFVGSPTGFSLQFNSPFLLNATTPVLYGQGFGATALPPSVIVTSDPGNLADTAAYVEGSLIPDPGTNSITFLATNTAYEANSGSPLLPDGTYTAIVRGSAANNGIQALNPGGGYLDGLGSGAAGSGDFTATFTVKTAASGADIVWVPDTADGPGQPLSAPGKNQTGGGFPIYLSSTSASVRTVQVTLNYDPNLLTITGVTGPAFTMLTSSTPGHAVLRYNGPALPAGPQTPIGFIVAHVPSGTAANPVPYRAVDPLTLTHLSLNAGIIRSAAGNGLHLVAYVGDADGNGTYSGSDAVLITRATLQTDTGFAAYPLVDPVIVADTDGAGFIPSDAALQVNEAGVGVPTANLPIPPLPGGVVFQTVIAPHLSPAAVIQGQSTGAANVSAASAHSAEGASDEAGFDGHLARSFVVFAGGRRRPSRFR